MDSQPLRHTFRVANSQGLHMRPSAAFAEVASRFESNVTVSRPGRVVNGKSPLDMMLLAAPQGTELTVEVDGPDARQALDALVALLESLGREETEAPPAPPPG